ncbi:MAG: hypothetical protein M3N28_01725 [Actinomycetota bacterium]|nr:hypothetical protein [Actinomycetota bacterium]
MAFRRHPSGAELGAWFDGEDDSATVGAHVSRCPRCRRSVSEMARVRSWIRAQPFFAMGQDEEDSFGVPARRWRPRVLALCLVLVLTLLVVNAPRLRGPERSRRGGGDPSGALFNAGGEGQARTPAGTEPQSPAEDGTGDDRRRSGSSAPPARNVLRLGLVVPTRGAAAAEGAEVARTVRTRVDAANASGGVSGSAVELVVTAAEDSAAVAALPGRVSVLVGGFGAAPPTGVPWLFPADPAVGGPSVVQAQASPEVAGQQVGELLRGRRLGGPVGVVVGSGAESALAAGLASKVPTTTAAAVPGASCGDEVASLRRDGAVALAVAGPPDLAVRCLRAAAQALWAPPFGTIVAPSAVYAGLDSVNEARGTRTVLGLPWPTAPGGGPARFRAAGGSRSYRALVSFAATELAIDVARQKGAVTAATVAAAVWRSDLFDMTGTTIRPIPVVMSTEGWVPAPELGAAPPLPPVLPMPLPGLSP